MPWEPSGVRRGSDSISSMANLYPFALLQIFHLLLAESRHVFKHALQSTGTRPTDGIPPPPEAFFITQIGGQLLNRPSYDWAVTQGCLPFKRPILVGFYYIRPLLLASWNDLAALVRCHYHGESQPFTPGNCCRTQIHLISSKSRARLPLIRDIKPEFPRSSIKRDSLISIETAAKMFCGSDKSENCVRIFSYVALLQRYVT